MKSFAYLYLLFILISCSGGGSNNSPQIPPTGKTELEIKNCIVKASDSKLEIATWNIEHFPKAANTTKELAEIIKKMDVDVIAIQEVTGKKKLTELDKLLPDYTSVIKTTNNIHLAYLYKTSEIKINGSCCSIKTMD